MLTLSYQSIYFQHCHVGQATRCSALELVGYANFQAHKLGCRAQVIAIHVKGAIKMRAALSNIPRCYQRNPHESAPNHERVCHPLLFGECQEFFCEPTEDVPIKCGVVRDPQVVEGRKQQCSIVERLAASFALFD
jgi:hypothetical protein